MKTVQLIIIAALLCSPFFGFSQEGEGTEVEQARSIDKISLTHNQEQGLQVKVHSIDSISGDVKDTTTIKLKHSTIYIVSENKSDTMDLKEERRENTHSLTYWNGLDLGVNGFLSPKGSLDIGEENDAFRPDYPSSRSLSINFLEQKLCLIKDYVGITTGLGIQWNSYKLKNDYSLIAGKDTVFAVLDSNINLKKNKLRTTWLNVPLLMEFNTSKDQKKNVHLGAGVVGGLHLETMFKQKYDTDGTSSRYKNKNDLQVNPYRLEAMVRVGYGSFNLFASYQMTELFEKGKGPELYPFTIGLTLVDFD